MLDIPKGGAVAAKIAVEGIPPHYGIPDGSYYLWMGRLDNRLRAVLARTDVVIQTELCAEEIEGPSDLTTNTLASSVGPTPCDRLKMAQMPQLPPGAKFPPQPPRPPPTQKRTLQDICYTENGNKPPVTKYRKGVVYVPDS